jgi:hypothetical protein
MTFIKTAKSSKITDKENFKHIVDNMVVYSFFKQNLHSVLFENNSGSVEKKNIPSIKKMKWLVSSYTN